MKKFINILNKELKELFTRQVLIPFVLTIFVFYLIGEITKSEIKKAEIPLNIGIIDLDNSSFSKLVKDSLSNSKFNVFELNSRKKEEIFKEAVSTGLRAVIFIPENFERDIKTRKGAEIKFFSIISSIGIKERIQKALAKKVIDIINSELSSFFIKELSKDANPEKIKNPIKAEEIVFLRGKSAPGNSDLIFAFIINQSTMVPAIMMLLLILTSTMIATSIGQEKENKTLETLLTVPVSRISIIIAKMVASSLLALFFAGAYLIGFRNLMSGPQEMISNTQPIPAELGLTFGLKEYIVFSLIIFLTLTTTLGIATIIALFAKDTKSAQALVTPLTLLILIPYFISIYSDPDELSLFLRIVIFIIPFSHSLLAYKRLIFGNLATSIFAIIYLAVFSTVLVYLAAKLFNSDRLLTSKLTFGFKRRT
ncbi:MAG: ABC transporter permease [Candidatus Aminicenantia bacterium]